MTTTTTTPVFKKAKDAESIVHTLSSPSKMPCYSYNIPAIYCKIGSKLRSIIGSVCSKCYALKGRYVFPNVLEAMEKRYASITSPFWVEALCYLINKKEKSGFFRWHDSGDVQDIPHLHKIVQVAMNLPHIKFWLPTREYTTIEKYMELYPVPSNLTIRLSAHMIDKEPPVNIAKKLGLVVSGVVTGEGFSCPSSKQGNICGSCRACWDKDVFCVNYHAH